MPEKECLHQKCLWFCHGERCEKAVRDLLFPYLFPLKEYSFQETHESQDWGFKELDWPALSTSIHHIHSYVAGGPPSQDPPAQLCRLPCFSSLW